MSEWDEAQDWLARTNSRACGSCWDGQHQGRHDSACECPCQDAEQQSCGCLYSERTDVTVAYCLSDGEGPALADQREGGQG